MEFHLSQTRDPSTWLRAGYGASAVPRGLKPGLFFGALDAALKRRSSTVVHAPVCSILPVHRAKAQIHSRQPCSGAA